MGKILPFIKSEAVLCAALLLAAVSAFIVPPDAGYIKYIDFRTLSILLSLMIIMAGFQKTGIFEYLAKSMLLKVKNARQLAIILVLLCFFFSMFITNDVALITFVPFTLITLEMTGGKEKMLIPIVAMQTTAANLGSMLTPVGNPQNLYLYAKSGMGVWRFLHLMLPYSALALIMTIIFCALRFKGDKISISFFKPEPVQKYLTFIYFALFVLCLMSVARVVPYPVTLAAVLFTAAASDRQILKNVDYTLILTFIGFFIFTGNIGRTDAFAAFLKSIVGGREVIVSAAASQIISNVPAALLLSGFTDNTANLIIGTNIGGLGTLIASMASLISFKYVARDSKRLCGKYLLFFTAVNIVFLAAMLGLYFIL